MVLSSFFFASCDDSKTYAEKLNDEKKAIKKFIAFDNISPIVVDEEELEAYTDQASFDEASNKHFKLGQWYKFQDGSYNELYMRINDFGDTSDMFENRDAIVIRYSKTYNLLNFEDWDSSSINNLAPNAYWLIPYWSVNYSGDYGVGVALPIRFLGKNANVSLIVPSKLGTSDDISNVVPYYYGEITYKLSSWSN